MMLLKKLFLLYLHDFTRLVMTFLVLHLLQVVSCLCHSLRIDLAGRPLRVTTHLRPVDRLVLTTLVVIVTRRG